MEYFGEYAITGLFLIFSSAAAAKITYGKDHRRTRDLFVVYLLMLAVGLQLYYLIIASMYIPSYPWTYDVSLAYLFATVQFTPPPRTLPKALISPSIDNSCI